MSMNFFEHQDHARRKTKWLILYFLISVFITVTLTYFLSHIILTSIVSTTERGQGPTAVRYLARLMENTDFWFNWRLAVFSLSLVGLIVGLAILFKYVQLSSGGEAVATMLGGTRIDYGTTDPDEKRVLNVVEEMAIASGLPVPPVYLLSEEEGINAFAAGMRHQDAVIGVTRGTIEQLTRDELQGVIGHECSHILNGDMRMNQHLMSYIFGLLVLFQIGYVLIQLFFVTARSSRHRRRDDKGGGIGAILGLIGLSFMIIGGIGFFFSRLLQSAISRQREFLADASAIQFTRHPGGLAGALKKIGGFTTDGSSSRKQRLRPGRGYRKCKLDSEAAPQASHMFFGDGLTGSWFSGLAFATHPPLPERIRRIDPSFEASGSRTHSHASTPGMAGPVTSGFAGAERSVSGGETSQTSTRSETLAAGTHQAVLHIGSPDRNHMDYAATLLKTLPEPISQAVHEPPGACSVICCLLLDSNLVIRRQQMALLEAEGVPRFISGEVQKLSRSMKPISRRDYLALIEIALPVVGRISEKQFRDFLALLQQLIRADQRTSLFEYALFRIVSDYLEDHYGKAKTASGKPPAHQVLMQHASGLIATLAHVGHTDPQAVQQAFNLGADILGIAPESLNDWPLNQCGTRTLDTVLNGLAKAPMAFKQPLIQALAACVTADGKTTIAETELLRTVALDLDCPMPPLLVEPTPPAAVT